MGRETPLTLSTVQNAAKSPINNVSVSPYIHSTSFPYTLHLFVEPQGCALQNTRKSWVPVRQPWEWPDQRFGRRLRRWVQKPSWQYLLQCCGIKAHKWAGAVSQTEINSCCPLIQHGKNCRASFFYPCWRAVLSSPFLMLNQQILVMKVFFCNIIFFVTLEFLLTIHLRCPQSVISPVLFFLAPFADLPCLYIEIVTRIEYSIPHGECIAGTEAASSHLCLSCAKRSKPNP